MKLIDYWTKENDRYLTDLLWKVVMNSAGYGGNDIPSYLEVKNFLKTTDAEGFKQYTMNSHLVIYFEDEKFELEII